MMKPPDAVLILKPRRAKPFFLRHPWVFSGAVDRIEGTAEKGGIVRVVDAVGRFIGYGFYNPESQIVARLFCWREGVEFDDGFWGGRIERAIKLRHETLHLDETGNAYRVVYSEADGLPGLIVDRYADYLTVQFLTAGINARKELILDALMEMMRPYGIVERSDAAVLQKEGMAPFRGVVRGDEPEAFVEIEGDGMRFLVDLFHGHKTGFYLDQRANRLAAARMMEGRRVLDLFCYTGGFAVAADRLGKASAVLAIDSSEPALELGRRNAALNGCDNIRFQAGHAGVALRELKKSGEPFGAVILDPPKFARTKPGAAKALRAYRDVNLLAMQLLAPGGVLVTCSCSGHVSGEEFVMMLNNAAMEANASLQILECRGQAADHPIIASCPQTAYLKCIIARVEK